eukprot:gb/GFBE01052941.1/.p1 GENE.gb/GFBE01052941.1/~~gb/GFBE01052941.1/.p1  ORF type:complete len:314 (+),score=82.76 gb/GFBE01052941.1/:1-942(+)
MSYPGESPSQINDDSVRKVALDGQAAVDARRKARHISLLTVFLIWLSCGTITFYCIEGWDPLETTLFNFSILTGVGYGHVVPDTPLGQIVTAIWIVAGLCIFSAIAGAIIDSFMQWEIGAMTDVFASHKDKESLHEKRMEERKKQFLGGLANAVIAYLFAVLFIHFRYGECLVDAIYLAAITVFGMDSLCGLDGVHCSGGWHSSVAGETSDMFLAMVWYVVMVTTMGHFTVSFAFYVGADSTPVLSRISKMSKERFARMDLDGDGKIKRSEFLRDRLLQGGLCQADQIDTILKNFDKLDKSGTGFIDKTDIAK